MIHIMYYYITHFAVCQPRMDIKGVQTKGEGKNDEKRKTKIFLILKKGLTSGKERDIILGQKRSVSAGMAEQADARDLKSRDTKVSYGFDSRFRHQFCKTEYRGVEQPGSSSGS